MKNENEKVFLSFVVPCYKSSKTIDSLLMSLAYQKTNHRFEVIFVIDDRDITDFGETSAIIKKTFSSIKNSKLSFSIIVDSSHSIGGARNIGLKAALGDYIWYVDSDDWLINSHAVEIVFDSFASAPTTHVALCAFACSNPSFNRYIVVWARIAEKALALRHLFPENNDQEDRAEATSFWSDASARSFINIAWPLYYYNWPRSDSVTKGKILQ